MIHPPHSWSDTVEFDFMFSHLRIDGYKTSDIETEIRVMPTSKSPQEQAEELVVKTVNDIDQYFQNEANYRPEMKMHIQHNIPLAELIAVARAAENLYLKEHTIAKHYLVNDFLSAIAALHATGKIEL